MRIANAHLADSNKILHITEFQLQQLRFVTSEMIWKVQVPHFLMHNVRNSVRILHKHLTVTRSELKKLSQRPNSAPDCFTALRS